MAVKRPNVWAQNSPDGGGGGTARERPAPVVIQSTTTTCSAPALPQAPKLQCLL